MSNDEIMARANKIATGLIAKGVSHGEAINLLMRNDIEFIVGMAAATQIGAVGTPINTHFSADDVAYIINDSGAKVVISHSDLWHNLSEKVIPLLEREVTILLVETPKYLRAPYKISDELCTLRSGDIELAEWESKFSPHEKAVSVRPAAMIYTSGTTGRPKGVRRKEAVSVKLKNHHNAYVAGMRCLLAAPLYHSAPFSTADGVFAVEGDLILTPRFDPEFYLTLIEKHRITHSFMVPTMFTRLLKLPDAIRLKYDVSSVEHIIHGGSPCPREIKMKMIDWFGPVFFELYGGTETGIVTYATTKDFLEHPGTVGCAVEGATIKIYDDDGNELPNGQVGEIYCLHIDCPDFTYQNRHEDRLAMEKYGLLSLGDVGYINEAGYLYITDRKRDMIISGGTNIYCTMVEAPFLDHPKVLDCAAFGIPHEELGETLALAVETVENAVVTEEELLEFAREKLGGYMVPMKIIFTKTLPRDPSGKIYKRKLRDPFWANEKRKI
ncbi:AMP-binding protein [uncultured Sneathiella sp.]|uniref:AMP-binding protein n=1 Tax=uncultured Sneathiella sp. TaxID=879315 RepID=UPI0030DC512D|tara:strand:+ start:785 stop:2275 length:1491 start_codon:yes stop_codon:yes gene_type:complete